MSDIQKTNNSNNRPNSTESGDCLFVVGIGASAGGLSALEELFDNLPGDSGAAFVVIQHLAPDFKSLMKELLERHTRMTVYRVTQGMKLYPNSVYLIPPGKTLTVEGNLLRLEERKKNKNDQHEFTFPIDLFFTSLAKNYREKAIGVVLSGSGTDGSCGLKTINEAGGIALAQDPNTAEFEGMPTSAISTGVVDRALSPKELAKIIYECIVSPLKLSNLAAIDDSEITASNIKTIVNLLLETENIDFSYYKISTMSRRIHRRRLINHFLDLPGYMDLLRKSVKERNILSCDLLINVTNFFRDPDAWKTIENKVLPVLIEQAKPYEELRFWVAACSTGEEAYSLAILIHEAIENVDKPLRIKIFATDLDRTALAKASLGIYPQSIAQKISSQRLQKYFLLKDNSYQVVRKLREMLIFSPHDLSKDVGFTRMHFISCRNVMIYMRSHLQQQTIRKLHFSLVVKGVLFLGEAESVGDFDNEFDTLDKRWKVYQKQRDVKLSLSRQSIPKVTQIVLNRSAKPSVLTSNKKSVHEYTLQRILEKDNSAVLLISKNNQLLHFYGDSSKILKPLYGKIVTDVIQMVTLPLQLPLKMALHRVKKNEKSVIYSNIRSEQEEESYSFRLEAIPPDLNYENRDLYLVKIETQTVYPSSQIFSSKENFQISDEAQQRILELEDELNHTRENLQALIEELETTNEEQQASNEELTSSNEELQSTNEELHSVNEELHTVNIEYQSKIQELTQLNNDVDNLLKSTDIGVIFLDRELKIRKFTPAATQVVFLRNSDLGRPLTEVTLKIDCPQLPQLLQKILESEEPIELEVRQKNSNCYLLMQINIYYTEDGCSEGLVISFVKIDEIKNVQIQLTKILTEKNRQLAAIETSRDGIAILNNDKFVYINQAHLEMFGYHKPEELLGLSWRVLYTPEEAFRLRKEIFPIVHSKGTWQGTAQAKHCQGHVFDEELTLTFTSTGDLICVCRDISDRLKIAKSLKESERRYRNLYTKTPVMLHSIDSEGKIISVSNYWLEKLGYTHEEVIGKKSTDFLTPESQKYAAHVLSEFLRTGNCQDVLYQWICKDGKLIDGLLSATSEWDEGKLVRSLAVIVDVTERRQKEQLERVNKAKDAFIAHMSHELRTPLNSILGFSSILKKELSSSPEQFYSINIINQSGHYLLALINDILDFSKIAANKMQLEPSRLNLIHFLKEIFSNFELSAKQRGLKFSLEIGDSVPQVVNVDKIRLRQILFNLLSNAVKFTQVGSVILKVNTIKDFSDIESKSKLPEKLEADCPMSDSSVKTVRFQVEDTGRGIPAAKLTNIFIPFEQLSNNAADKKEGTGLGLAISRDIVRLMGGELKVKSEVSQGSKFWFDIELLEIKSNSLLATRESHSLTLQKLNTPCKVLVVDDYKDNRTLLINYLKPYGFTLTEASNGQEGLEIAKVFQPEVILVDLAMPVMNGIEMIAKIRQRPNLQSTVIIAISANSEFILGKSEVDCDDFLSKPVNLEILIETLNNLLQLDWQFSELSEPEQESPITAPEQQELIKLIKSAEIGDISNLKLLLKSLTDQSDQYLTFIQEVERLIDDLRLNQLEEFLQSYL